MTSLTIISLMLLIYATFSARGFAPALALAGATPAGAALVVSGIAVPTFYFVALGLAGACAALFLTNRWAHVAIGQSLGVSLLFLFGGWALAVTIVAPFFFDGIGTHVPGEIDSSLVAGHLSSSNLAQITYLLLALLIVLCLARSPSIRPQLIGLLIGSIIWLCFWAYLHQQFGFPYPEDFFDNSPSFRYIDTAAGGLQRFRGIFSEPAGLALVCVSSASYMLSRAARVRGVRQLLALSTAALSIYLGIVSTSATFVVGGVIVSFLALCALLFGFLVRRFELSVAVGTLAPFSALALIWLVPIVSGFAQAAIDEKVASSSYTERGSLDTDAYSIWFDTYGVGVGLGSNRASSFLPNLASTTGTLGVGLFLIAVSTLLIAGWKSDSHRPVAWALIGFFAVKFVSGPDLSDTSGILWIALGILASIPNTRVARSRWSEPSLTGAHGVALPRTSAVV